MIHAERSRHRTAAAGRSDNDAPGRLKRGLMRNTDYLIFGLSALCVIAGIIFALHL
jgi:hypothetical protein